jgi:hypothetical protein
MIEKLEAAIAQKDELWAIHLVNQPSLGDAEVMQRLLLTIERHPTIRSLRLSGCAIAIGDEEALEMLQSGLHQLEGLDELDLSYNPLGQKDVETVLMALFVTMPPLRTLNLAGIIHIKDALSKLKLFLGAIKTLRVLVLRECELGSRITRLDDMPRVLTTNQTLRVLDLSFCHLTNADVRSLARLLRKNCILATLRLHGNPALTPRAGVLLADALKCSNHSLTQLSVDEHAIGPAANEIIAAACSRNQTDAERMAAQIQADQAAFRSNWMVSRNGVERPMSHSPHSTSASAAAATPVVSQSESSSELQRLLVENAALKAAALAQPQQQQRPNIGSSLPPLSPTPASLPLHDHILIFDRYLDKGSSGEVWLAHVDGQPHEQRAVKIITLPANIDEHDPGAVRVLREFDMQAELVSDHIVRHYASVRIGHKLYLVLEYCAGGTLRQYLVEPQAFYDQSVPVLQQLALPEFEAQRLMRQLALGLSELQRAAIMHRDLKPENLLFKDTDRQQIKISDFGVARSLNDCADSQGASTHVGSNGYKPPEVLRGGLHDLSGDMWTLGIILFEMLTGHRPFFGCSDLPVLRNIHRMCPDRLYMEEVRHLSENCKKLLPLLLEPERDDRIGFDNFKQHLWIKQAIEMANNDELEPGMPPVPAPAAAVEAQLQAAAAAVAVAATSARQQAAAVLQGAAAAMQRAAVPELAAAAAAGAGASIPR